MAEAPQASRADFALEREGAVEPEVSGQLKDSTNVTEDSPITASYRQGELIFLMVRAIGAAGHFENPQTYEE